MSHQSDSTTREALDQAIRAHAEPHIDDGEVITRWLTIAATQRFDGGGVIITLTDDAAVPRWQIRGLLHEALSLVEADATEDRGQGGDVRLIGFLMLALLVLVVVSITLGADPPPIQ